MVKIYNKSMRKTDELIKELIKTSEPKSSKNLAFLLGVSSKTIINYINEINAVEEIIYFTKEGYWIDKERATKYLEQSDRLPQDYNERANYIINNFLLLHHESINIYKLCDDLFVSYSTIKNDISKMNLQYRNLGIRFFLRKNELYIDGNEKNKRKLMSKMIYDQHKNILSLRLLEESFSNVDVSLLAETINWVLKEHNYYLNDFSRMNIIIHYSIIIDRMRNGHTLNSKIDYDLSEFTSSEISLVEDLNKELSAKFQLKLSKSEIYDLLILIRANAQKTEIENTDIFKEYVNKDIAEYVNKLIAKLKNYYYLDLNDDQFIVPFTLHLNNLVERLKYSTTLNNPMSAQLKDNSPVLYDIALFVAQDFCNEFNFESSLSSDEVGFIAIHIGSQIERDNIGIGKLNVVLVCPDYIHIAAMMRNKILYNLGTKINIANTITDIAAYDLESYDAIISIVEIPNVSNIPMTIVSPFITDMDIAGIFDMVSKTKSKKTLQILKNEFDIFFNASNFIVINGTLSKNDVIKKMAGLLERNGNVTRDFEEKVKVRENSCPTCYYNFAIPHSFEMDAIQSGICVLISKQGIEWNDNIVNIVLMIALNQDDNLFFYQLYEAIINLLTNETYNNIIKNMKHFDEFQAIIQNI